MKIDTKSLSMQGWWSIGPKGVFLVLPDEFKGACFGPDLTFDNERKLWSLTDAIEHYLGFGQLKKGYLRITAEKLDESSPVVVEITTEISVEE